MTVDDRMENGTLATALGAVTLGSVACLAGMFAFQSPLLGSTNDLGNGAVAALGGLLAWRLRRGVPRAATAAAIGGAAIAAVGSALVLSRATGFFLAGLVTCVGYAGLGLWLVAAARSHVAGAWPVGLRRLALGAGGLMAVGIAALPGIALRLDDMGTAPAWTWLAFVGWAATAFLYPAWALWLGRLRPSALATSPATA